jgi:hypothetical protein
MFNTGSEHPIQTTALSRIGLLKALNSFNYLEWMFGRVVDPNVSKVVVPERKKDINGKKKFLLFF